MAKPQEGEPVEPAPVDAPPAETPPSPVPVAAEPAEPGPGEVVAVALVKWNGLDVGTPTVVADSEELRSAAEAGLVEIR